MTQQLVENLVVASCMVALTVVVHFFGILSLLFFLRHRGARFRTHESLAGQGALVLVIVFGLVALHTVEIWLYAALFHVLGELPDFEAALYFSTVTFASLGYGDIVLGPDWRMVAAIESANGLILFGWSTAFLMSVMARLKALEHDWLER